MRVLQDYEIIDEMCKRSGRSKYGVGQSLGHTTTYLQNLKYTMMRKNRGVTTDLFNTIASECNYVLAVVPADKADEVESLGGIFFDSKPK